MSCFAKRRGRRLPLSLMAISLLFGSALGCARSATFSAQRPAAAPVQGMRTLAVLPTSGPHDSGSLAQQKLIDTLRQNPAYQVVDGADLDRAAGVSPHYRGGEPTLQDRLAAARFLGVDSLVDSRVRQDGNDGYSVGFANVVIGEPRLTVHLDVFLVDVASGRQRGLWTTSETHVGELEKNPKKANSRPRVIERLAAQSAEKAAKSLAPHEQPVQVKLAGSVTAVMNRDYRAGVSHAQAGDWEAARESFAAVAAAEPENHVALYNLAVASEATHDFAGASKLYQQAIDLRDEERYQAGLQRVQQADQDYQLAMQQRQSQAPATTRQPPVQYAHQPPPQQPTPGIAPATYARPTQLPLTRTPPVAPATQPTRP